MAQRPITNQAEYEEYTRDPAAWAQYGNDWDANGVRGGGAQSDGVVVPNPNGQVPSDEAIRQENANIAAAPFQNAEARKKERFDINSSRLASIFFREQSIGGTRKQQPDMLSEFLGL